MESLSKFLTSKRIKVYALTWSLCLWFGYAYDIATPGLRDRVGLLKGGDFVHFYTGGYLVRTGNIKALYDPVALVQCQLRLVPQSYDSYFAANYGPQVYLLFSVLSKLSYVRATIAWAVLSIIVYVACCYILLHLIPVKPYNSLALLLAIAFPGFFNLVAFGQTSVIALVLFVIAFLGIFHKKKWATGLAIGSLIYKPQLGLASALVFLLAAEWEIVISAVISLASQLLFAWKWFGIGAMRIYFYNLLHVGRLMPIIEWNTYQMSSLRGFWLLLLPWHKVAFSVYVVSSIAVIALAVVCWKKCVPKLGFAALLLATVLVGPHIMVYDEVILMPAFLFIGSEAMKHEKEGLDYSKVLLATAYTFCILAPIAPLTYIQLSTVGFSMLLGGLYHLAK